MRAVHRCVRGCERPCRVEYLRRFGSCGGRGDYNLDITTNTVEGYYSIFKRGMKGVYQHCSKKHLHRYLSEFDFLYANRASLGVDDDTRAEIAAKGIVGKGLTYRRPHGKTNAAPN